MKTNVNMIRRMGDFEVKQRTKYGMFNATELLKQWNAKTETKKRIEHFFENKQTKEFIQTIQYEEHPNSRNSGSLELIENEELPNRGNSAYLKTRGNNGGTWMHPFLFLDFAMWLNPRFKYHVIKFVYDELIKFRHNAGDNYKSMAGALTFLDKPIYEQIAKAINYIVFGMHGKNLRQNATPEQLDKLAGLESTITDIVLTGLIRSHEQLMDFLRKRYSNSPKRLTA